MRSFTIVDAPQRSPEWFAARVGRLTGTSAGDMLAQIKTGEAAARRDLRTRLVVERLTGVNQEDAYVNAVMQRGLDREADARLAYEALTGTLVEQTGFLAHTDLLVGCSIDGHVGDFEGIVELKVPKSATHLRYLKGGAQLPVEHKAQVLHNLWITGAAWCDFVSFDDRFPPELQVFRVRVPRVEIDVLAYEKVALKFLDEVDAELEHVRQIAALQVA